MMRSRVTTFILYFVICSFCIISHLILRRLYNTLCNHNLIHYYIMKDANVCMNLKAWITFLEDISAFSLDLLTLNAKTSMKESFKLVENILH